MWRRMWDWIRGHTIRAKIGWSFALIRGLLYPSVILAMVYLFWMASLVDKIAREDARLIRIAELLDVNFLEARKAEKNYALLGDRAYLDRHRESTRSLRALLEEGRRLAGTETGLAGIERAVGEYLAAFEELVRQRPSEQPARGRAAMARRIAEHQRAVEAELEAFRKLVRSRRAYDRLDRSLRDRLATLLVEMEAAAQAEEQAIPGPLFERLRRSGDEVQRLALAVAERRWQRLEVHREQALRLRQTALWVIGTTLGATFGLNMFLTYLLPRRILAPIRELVEACQRIEAEDLSVRVEEGRRDEFGDLARAFNRMVAAVRSRVG